MTQRDEVRRLLERQRASGRFPGGKLVVRRGGEVVLDVATGVARGFRAAEGEAPVPVTPTTCFAVFSASKPVVALALAMLEDRGAIDVNAPVAKYFPAFAANGKSEITVLEVLTHRACVFTPELLARPRDWGSEEKVRGALVQAKPRFPAARWRTCRMSTGGFSPRSCAAPRGGGSTSSSTPRSPRRPAFRACASERRRLNSRAWRRRTGSAPAR
jgi:CubicO group peptidase (beta-lactamase class C family)